MTGVPRPLDGHLYPGRRYHHNGGVSLVSECEAMSANASFPGKPQVRTQPAATHRAATARANASSPGLTPRPGVADTTPSTRRSTARHLKEKGRMGSGLLECTDVRGERGLRLSVVARRGGTPWGQGRVSSGVLVVFFPFVFVSPCWFCKPPSSISRVTQVEALETSGGHETGLRKERRQGASRPETRRKGRRRNFF